MKSENKKYEHCLIDLSDENSIPISHEDHDSYMSKELILKQNYSEIDPLDFYRYIFPEGSFERLKHQEDQKPNAIAIAIDSETKIGTKTIVTDGLEQLPELLKKEFVITSPISYYGRSRKASMASLMYALTLDIDYVGEGHLGNLINWFEELNLIPRPTFIVNSGHGVHLYYVFDKPIAMYEKNQKELTKLKRRLIDKTWTKFTSEKPERKEALGVVQGFRMVGSPTKLFGYRLKAFKSGDRVSLDYLNSYANEGHEAHIDQSSLFSLDQAKQEWPEWYENRIVKRERPGRWHIKRDLYDWWKRRIESETTIGHRYFCLMCLAVYARKCNIEEDELRSDAAYFQEHFNSMGDKTGEPFTWEEAEKALEAYNEDYVTFPRDTIERISAITIHKNKRNYQKQLFHLEEARAIRDIRQKRKKTNWYDNGGRPKGSLNKNHPKKDLIINYKKEHPELSNRQIAQDLKISRNTVNKWLKK